MGITTIFLVLFSITALVSFISLAIVYIYKYHQTGKFFEGNNKWWFILAVISGSLFLTFTVLLALIKVFRKRSPKILPEMIDDYDDTPADAYLYDDKTDYITNEEVERLINEVKRRNREISNATRIISSGPSDKEVLDELDRMAATYGTA